MSFQRDQGGVTAVLGTIMILGITVMGITAVMFWGGPTLQRIQEQNAQAAMLGEFQEIRRDSLVLSITDSSRVPRINLEAGTFGMTDGTRMQVSAMWDATQTCDFHVIDWGDTNSNEVRFKATGCGAVEGTNNDPTPVCSGDACFRAYRVTGSNIAERRLDAFSLDSGIYTARLQSADLTQDDWMFELGDATGSTSYAQAWLISTNSIFWELNGASSVGLILEGGAVFSSRDGTIFIQEQPPIDEEAFGTRDFVLRIPTYSGSQNEFTGRSTPSLFLGLVGNHLRTSEDKVHTVRMDFLGDGAQAWCNTLMAHNGILDQGGSYDDSDGPCDGTGLRSLKYTSTAGTFPFEFIHARITTAL